MSFVRGQRSTPLPVGVASRNRTGRLLVGPWLCTTFLFVKNFQGQRSRSKKRPKLGFFSISSYSFRARTFISSWCAVLTKAEKWLKPEFWLGPRIGLGAPKSVKIFKFWLKILSPPTVFELGRSNFRGALSSPRRKNDWSRNFDWGPRFLGAGFRKF